MLNTQDQCFKLHYFNCFNRPNIGNEALIVKFINHIDKDGTNFEVFNLGGSGIKRVTNLEVVNLAKQYKFIPKYTTSFSRRGFCKLWNLQAK